MLLFPGYQADTCCYVNRFTSVL